MAYSTQTCNTISVNLDETNYPTWAYQMQHYLRGHGFLKFMDGSHLCPPLFLVGDDGSLINNSAAREKWMEQDSLVIFMITTTLSTDALSLVIGCQTSMEVWLTLKQRYAFVSESHIMQLKAALHNIRKGYDSIDKYLLRFKYMRDRLAVAGVEMNDQDAKFFILAGLPVEYGHTRQIIRGKHDIAMDEVRSLLLSAENEIALEHKALPFSHVSAMFAQNGGNGAWPSMPNVGNTIFNTAIPWSANCAASSTFNMHNGCSNISNGASSGFNFGGSSPSANSVGFMSYGPNHPSTGFFNAHTGFVNNFSGFMNPSAGTHTVNNMSYGLPHSTTSFVSPLTNTGFVQQMGYGFGSQPSSTGYSNNLSPSVNFMSNPTLQASLVPNDGSFIQQRDGGNRSIPGGNFNEQNGTFLEQKVNCVGMHLVHSQISDNPNTRFSTQQNDVFTEVPIRNFSDRSYREDHITYPNFFVNRGCFNSNNNNRNDDFKPKFNTSEVAKKRDSKLTDSRATNPMTSNIQILQNVLGESEMACSVVSTTTKSTEKNQVGASCCFKKLASPKALSATICTQLKPPFIAIQSNVNASHSQDVKPLLYKEIEAFPIPSTWLATSTQDKILLNCRQDGESSILWRSLPLIPPG